LNEDKIFSIFQRANKDDAFKQLFFKKLSTTNNPYPWFDKLITEGYLDPINNKNPIITNNNYIIPRWYALDYLENVATNLSKNNNSLILNKLIKSINLIITFKKDGRRIENPYTDYKLLRIIFLLPVKRITKKHIEFIRIILTSKFSSILPVLEIDKTVIPHLTYNKDKEKLMQTLKIILDYKIVSENSKFFQFKSILEDYWLSIIIQKNGDKIIAICEISLAELILDIMKRILEKNKAAFGVIDIPTIEENKQVFLEDNYQMQLIYFLRQTLEHLTPPAQKGMLNEFLKSDKPIFKRISIHLINYFYEDYAQIFWQWDDNPLEEEDLKHEIYVLIKNNHNKFNNKQVNNLLKWITSIKTVPIKDNPEESPQQIVADAYKKLEWLSALEGNDYKKVNSLIKKYSNIYKDKIEHPGHHLWTSSEIKVAGAPEAFPPDIINKSNADLVKYISEYSLKKAGHHKIDVLYNFTTTVRENPDKFASDIDPFAQLDFEFQEALISGFTDAWKKNKVFSVKCVLDFLNNATSNQLYKEDKNPQKNVFTKSIADLIFEGTKNENHAFDNDLLPICESILLRLANNTKSTVKNDNTTDIITAVLNSPLGIVYYAMITCSLRFTKVKNNVDDEGVETIKSHYQSLIHSNRTIEFEVSLGAFLPHLYYLDKAWTKANINKLFPKEDEFMWKCGFSSYLFYSTMLSQDLYQLLKKNGHYKKAIEYNEKDVFEKLPQHICIAYLNDLEDFSEESLIIDLITGSNVDYIVEFVNFFCHLRNKLDAKMKDKVKPIWKKIIANISSVTEKDKYYEVFTQLSYWLSIVDNVDSDIVELMKWSNKYLNDMAFMFYVEQLNIHVIKNPEHVADIFYDFSSNTTNHFPYVTQEKVIALVDSLFERGQRENAKRICNEYLSKGIDFLRPVYEKNKN